MMITADDAIKALREVVAERGPEYVYVPPGLREPVEFDSDGYQLNNDDCKYVEEDGTPSCAVGVVVSKLDPDAFKNLVNFEGKAPSILVHEGAIDATPDAVAILATFQIKQDASNSYGTALAKAEGRYNAI